MTKFEVEDYSQVTEVSVPGTLQPVRLLGGQPIAAMGNSASRSPVRLFVGWLVGIIVLVGLWQVVTMIFSLNVQILPTPRLVFDALSIHFIQLLQNARPTLTEAGVGFLLSAVIAIPLGLVLARPSRFAGSIQAMMLSAQVFPKIALAPLLVVWFGFGLLPKLLFVVLMTFFPIALNATAGFTSVSPEVRNLGRVLGMGSFDRFRHIEGPSALPQIFSGLKISASFAVVAAIVCEFVASNSGLGYVIEGTTQTLNTSLMFAALILVAVLGFALYGIIALLEKIFVPWHVSRR